MRGRFRPLSGGRGAAAAATTAAALLSCAAGATLAPPAAFDTGFVEVNATTGSKLFYWFTPAASGNASAPIVVWLNGGPGSSSFIGSFSGLGPHGIVSGRLVPRGADAWCETFNLLVVDQPAGTGYSFTLNDAGYATGMADVARDFVAFLKGFFAEHPELAEAGSPLWITGESYAGKYVPAIATLGILQSGLADAFRFRGVAIGNGLTEPADMALTMADSYYSVGLLDALQRDAATEMERQCADLAAAERWPEATAARDKFQSYIANATGGANREDVRLFHDYNWTYIEDFMNSNATRELLRIPPSTPQYCVSHCPAVYDHLSDDIMKGYSHLIPPILASGRQVMLYQGQMDLRDGVAATEAWLAGALNMTNPGVASGVLAAERHVWRDAGDAAGTVAGYVRTHANLTHVVVVNAGHMVPMDQPARAHAMVQGLVAGSLGGVSLRS